MTVEAPPVAPEAPGSPPESSIGALVRASATRGLAAFAIVTALGVALGLAEFAATNGAYRLWTWVKVGFLYLLSFCGVGLRVDSAGVGGFGVEAIDLTFRLPMMTGTALIVWLLFRVGRASGRRAPTRDIRHAMLPALAAVVAFATPCFLVSWVSTLRFPDQAVIVTPVPWEAAVLPLGLALGAVMAGTVGARRAAEGEGSPRTERVLAMVQGGWHMFLAALVLAFIGFLVLAAVKPDHSGAYARFVRDAGRLGVVEGVHHALLLPDQSIWLLAPAMGGSTEVVVHGAQGSPTTIRLWRVDGGALGRLLYPSDAFEGRDQLVLGGGFGLFLLAPIVATVLGGRAAARGSLRWGERVLRGAGAGVVFGVLVAAGAWFSVTTAPLSLPLVGLPSVLPASIYATMPLTAALALTWGVAGGVLGAMSFSSGGSIGSAEELPGPP